MRGAQARHAGGPAPPGGAGDQHARDRGLRRLELVVAGAQAAEQRVVQRALAADRPAQLGELLPHVVEDLLRAARARRVTSPSRLRRSSRSRQQTGALRARGRAQPPSAPSVQEQPGTTPPAVRIRTLSPRCAPERQCPAAVPGKEPTHRWRRVARTSAGGQFCNAMLH